MGQCGLEGAADAGAGAASSAEGSLQEFRATSLLPSQYYVARQGGTERPWASALNHVKGTGDFLCVCCGTKLFRCGPHLGADDPRRFYHPCGMHSSSGKFDSGSGWPSFFEPAAPGVVEEHRDVSHGMVRTEVRSHRRRGRATPLPR